MEIWGHCEDCDRWFYCSMTDERAEWACPVCAAEPVALVNRAS